ncbi:MAG: DUF4184 family protein [Promethearchaeota archaeon]
MPSSFLSHQAPALPLKVMFPKRIDGTALCFGTFIPDLNFIVQLFFPVNFYAITHSLLGQILWTVPLAVIATIIFSKYLSPIFAHIASQKGVLFKPLKYFGVDQWGYLSEKKYNKKFWITAVYSSMIGGVLHILLDWPSHRYGYILYPWITLQAPDFLLYTIIDYGTRTLGPFVFNADLTVFRLLWFLETLIGGVITLYVLRFIKKHDLIRRWYEEENYIDTR